MSGIQEYIRNTADLSECCKLVIYTTWPGCSKLTTLLVNILLKFQTLISQIHQYVLLKNCEKLKLSCFQQKISVCLVMKS